MTWRRLRPLLPILIVLIVIACGTAIAFSQVIGPGDGLFYRDHTFAFRPRFWFVREAFRAGHLPARTLAAASGVPLEGLINGTYTPLTLILLFGDFDVVYDLFVAAHVALLASGAYVLARSLRVSRTGSLAAAAVALFGPIISWENLLVALIAFAYAPWMYWAFLRLLERPSLKWIGALGLFAAFHIQGLMPETLWIDVIAALLLLVHARRTKQLASPKKIAIALSAAGAIAFAGAAVQLMPALHLLASSRRWSGFTYAEQAQWPLKPLALLDLIAPSIWTLPEMKVVQAGFVSTNNKVPYLISLYFGMALPIASAAFFDRRTRKTAIVLGAIALFALIAALGDATPLHRLVVHLPLMKSARYPIKLMALTAVMLGALQPFGLRAMVSRPRVALIAFSSYGLLLFIAWTVFGAPEVKEAYAQSLTIQPTFPSFGLDRMFDAVIAAQRERIFVSLLGAIAAVACCVLAIKLHRRALFGLALTVLLWIDLAVGAQWGIVGVPVNPQFLPEVNAILRGDRFYMSSPDSLPLELTHEEGRSFTAEYLWSMRMRGEGEFRIARLFHDYDPDGQSQPLSTYIYATLQHSRAEILLGRLGIRWLTAWKDVERPGRVKVVLPNGPPQWFYPVTPVREYQSVFSEWLAVKEDDLKHSELARFLSSKKTWNQALVFDDDVPPMTSTSTEARECREATRVELLPHDDEDRIPLRVHAACDSLVMVLETFNTRWAALVDGAPVKARSVELGFIGAFVPAGDHEVVFEYRSMAAEWFPLSLAGWTVGLLLLLAPMVALRASRAAKG